MRVLFTLALITALLALDAIAQDSDNDGLTDAQERILGTDPNKPDTDGDGLLDGEEYFVYFTTPTKADTDEDGLNDKQDPYPRWLRYEDLNGVAISTDRILQGPQGLRLHQVVEVRAGNVITTDWYNFLHPDFTMREARFTIKFDFLDPNRPDYQGEGYYKPVDANQMEILLPTYEGIFRATIPWPGRAMAYNDWIYHLYSKPLQVGQTYEYNVFFSEVIRWGKNPSRARAPKSSAPSASRWRPGSGVENIRPIECERSSSSRPSKTRSSGRSWRPTTNSCYKRSSRWGRLPKNRRCFATRPRSSGSPRRSRWGFRILS